MMIIEEEALTEEEGIKKLTANSYLRYAHEQ
jgi:hypothetical protein